MMAFLDGLATAFDSVIQTTLQATVLAALVLVLQRLLGKRLAPRWQYALWLLVLIRLFLPWTPESPTSVFNYVRTEHAPRQLAALNADPELSPIDWQVEFSAVPPFTDAPDSIRVDITEVRMTWADWLGVLWVGVAALLALYVCIVNGSLWWRVRSERTIEAGSVADEFAECKQIMGVRTSIRLIRTGTVSTPALLGLIRPRLLLPESMEHTLSREELRHVFLHELAHYRRGDLVVNWLMVACNVVHWFNPALWYAFHRMRADRELACDALAMSYIAPEETSSYGRTLLRLLEHVARPRPLPGLVGVMERRSHLKKRIRGIAGFRPGSYRWSILAVALIAVLSAVALTSASTQEAAEESPEPVRVTESEPARLSTKPTETVAAADPEEIPANRHEGVATPRQDTPGTDGDMAHEDEGPVSIGKEMRRVLRPEQLHDGKVLDLHTGQIAEPSDSGNANLAWSRLAGIPGEHVGVLTHGIAFWTGPTKPVPELVGTSHVYATTEVPAVDLWSVSQVSDLPPGPEYKKFATDYSIAPLGAPAADLYPYPLPYQYVFQTMDGDIGVFEISEVKDRNVYVRYKFLELGVQDKSSDSVDSDVDSADLNTESEEEIGDVPDSVAANDEELPDPPVLVRLGAGNTITADRGHVDMDAMKLELSGSIVVDAENGEDVRVTDGTATLVLEGPKKGTLEDLQGDKIEVFKELPPESRDDMLPVEEDLDDESPRVRVEGESTALTADRMILDLETDEITLNGNVQGDIAHDPNDLRSGNLTFNLSAEGVSTNVKVTEAVSGNDEPAVAPFPNPEIMEKLDQPVSLEFEDEHIATIAAFMATYLGVPIAIDDEVVAPKGTSSVDGATFATDGMVPYVKLDNVPLKDALKAILRPLGLAYEVRGDTIIVSTPDRPHTEAPPSVSETQSKLDDVMLSISIQEGTTLLEAAAKLADAAEINVIVDRRVVNADDGTSSDPTVWVVRPEEFRDAPILDVLRAILDPLGLTFSVEPGFIWISSPDRIATESFEELETRVYPLDHLPALKYSETRESILAAIRRIVLVTEPDTGRAISRVALQEEEDALVVHSAPSHLVRLEQFLRGMRAAVLPMGNIISLSSTSPPSHLPPARFTLDLRSYRLSRRDMERTLEDWAPVSGAETLHGDPRVYLVPLSIGNPIDVLPDTGVVVLGEQRTHMTYGSSAKYALSMPKGFAPLPGFDLRGYLGHAPDARRELVKQNESGEYESVPWPKAEAIYTARAEGEYIAVYPGIEPGPDGTLLMELLWQSLERIPGIGEDPPQQHAAFARYPVKLDQWTAMTFPKIRNQHYLVFARVTEGPEAFDAATTAGVSPDNRGFAGEPPNKDLPRFHIFVTNKTPSQAVINGKTVRIGEEIPGWNDAILVKVNDSHLVVQRYFSLYRIEFRDPVPRELSSVRAP